MTRGVAVGKFNPPHLGHRHLIETAAAQVDRLYVLLCDRPDQSVAAGTRAAWLADASPDNVEVLITPDDLPEQNEPWARRALELLPATPDVAFTSEPWGSGWAECMGARHVCVDLDRRTHPISARVIRDDLGTNFGWLVPAARADLARRAVVIGAESTGKTTIAGALAAELGTVWVPEHGRWYWEGRRHLADQSWASDEFHRIVEAHRRLEADLARLATRGLVVVDTDALVTAVWHERYLGSVDDELEDLACRPPDLYLLCEPDFDWVQDGTRESRSHRIAMHEAMRTRAERSGAPIVTLRGAPDERLQCALEAIRPLTEFPRLI